jgi:hypothetical protein
VGEESPSESESTALWDALQAITTNRTYEVLTPVESFIQEHPASGWTPSLRANLAVWYRHLGRYTLALEHWESAWDATRHFQSGSGKRLCKN